MLLKESIEEGQDNIFKDLDVSNPTEKQLKAKVALKVNSIIAHRHLKQNGAASLLGLTQNKISDLHRGKLRGFSLAKLFEILNKLDRDIEIKIKLKAKSKQKGVTQLIYK